MGYIYIYIYIYIYLLILTLLSLNSSNELMFKMFCIRRKRKVIVGPILLYCFVLFATGYKFKSNQIKYNLLTHIMIHFIISYVTEEIL